LLVSIRDTRLFLRTAFLAAFLGGLAGGLIDQEIVSRGTGVLPYDNYRPLFVADA
jgi:hypothetical protein